MSEVSKIPENCFKCAHSTYCNAVYYGGPMCKYRQEIDKHLVELSRKRERGG